MGEQSPIIDGHVKLRDGKKVSGISFLRGISFPSGISVSSGIHFPSGISFPRRISFSIGYLFVVTV